MAAITLHGLCKSFGRTRVIEDMDLEVRDREFVVFVGPSGCGKSTLLRLIAGLEDPSGGEIRFDDEVVNDLPPAERGIAMVFQSYALYPHMNVFDNMAFGLRIAGGDRAAVAERVRHVARILQLDELLDRRPRELSGGQRQRVAIGRAIVRNPRVFLFDEPLSNLDAALRVQMRIEIARLHRELDTTMIYVTHDQTEAMTLADRIVVVNEGRVEQVGTPLELYRHPDNLFVAGFIGSPQMNLIAATVTEVRGEDFTVETDDGAALTLSVRGTGLEDGRRIVVGIRPEALSAGEGGEVRFDGRVVAVEHLGCETWIHLSHRSGGALLLRGDGTEGIAIGDTLTACAPASACYLFDESGCAIEPPGG